MTRVCGANIAEISKAVANLATQQPSRETPLPVVDLNTRLRNLINRASIMLFMKGNANEPRCGFSRKMVDILQSAGVQFDTFDILSDEEVRQGLCLCYHYISISLLMGLRYL